MLTKRSALEIVSALGGWLYDLFGGDIPLSKEELARELIKAVARRAKEARNAQRTG